MEREGKGEWGVSEGGRVSAKINLQHLISLFEFHLSHGAAASNHDSVNIQRVAFYYLRLCFILLIYFQILCTHVRLRDIEEEGRIKDKCEGKKGKTQSVEQRARE